MSSSRSSKKGFTLVELMASMAVGMVVLMVAATMLRTTGDGYERVGGGVNAEREARALLGQLTADLSSATYHEDSLFDKSSERWPVDQLGFLTMQPDDAQTDEKRIGDLCAVRYYVKDQKMGGKMVRCLMRGFVESNDTFRSLKMKNVPDLFKEPADTATNTDEAIAFGVISFEARPMTRDKAGKLSDWSKASGDPPDEMAIKLVLARRELAAKLTNANDWSGKGNAASLIDTAANASRNKNFQVYETFVRFGYHEPK